MKQRLRMLLLLLMLGLYGPVSMASGAGTEQLLKKAEELMTNHRDSEALAMYEQVLLAAPENYTALCKASVLVCRMGERITDDGTKEAFYAKAKEYAMRAYALKPADAESNFVMALSVGALAMVSGPKQRLAGINQMKAFLDTALSEDKTHAGSWYLLGRWHFKMANLNFAETTAAKMFFGGISDKATNEAAAEAINTAIKYSPNQVRYYYDLAIVYKEMKNTDACKQTLQQALALQVSTREELEISRRCKLMLQDYNK